MKTRILLPKVAAKRLCLAMAVLSVSSPVTKTAEAAVLFNTFGPGGTFSPITSYNVRGPLAFGGERDVALPFVTPNGDFVLLESVEFPARSNPINSNIVDLIIAADNGGIPGMILSSNVIQITAASDAEIFTASYPANFILAGSSTYWVWLSARGNGATGWMETSAPLSEPLFHAGSYDGGLTWGFAGGSTAPAVRVLGQVIPEPSRALLALLAFASVGLRRRR